MMDGCMGNRTSFSFDMVREVFVENSRVTLPRVFIVLINIVAFVICIIGFAGNGLVCLVVLRNPAMRIPRNVFITNLALADFTAALTIIPFVLWPQLENNHWKYGEMACKFYNTFSGMNVFCNSLTIIAVATDRYFAVKKSRPNDYKNNKPVVVASAMIWVISLICCIPIAIFYQINIFTVPLAKIERDICIDIIKDDNQTVLPFLPICKYLPPNQSWKLLVTIAHLLFLLPIPLGVVTAFNWQLHSFLRSQGQRHRSLTSIHSTAVQNQAAATRHRKLTLLLVVMVLSHGLFWLPFTVFTWTNDFHRDIFHNHPVVFRGVDISIQLLAYCSIGVNPFLYAYFNTNFNREFRRLYQLLLRRAFCARCSPGRGQSIVTETAEYSVSTARFRSGTTRTELAPLCQNGSTNKLIPRSISATPSCCEDTSPAPVVHSKHFGVKGFSQTNSLRVTGLRHGASLRRVSICAEERTELMV